MPKMCSLGSVGDFESNLGTGRPMMGSSQDFHGHEAYFVAFTIWMYVL